MKIIPVVLFSCASTLSFATGAVNQNPSSDNLGKAVDSSPATTTHSNANANTSSPHMDNTHGPNTMNNTGTDNTTNTNSGSATGTGTVQGNGVGTGSGIDTGIGAPSGAQNPNTGSGSSY